MNKIATYIIIPNSYRDDFSAMLIEKKFKCTFLSTTGMFLKTGQTTCLIVTDKDNYEVLKNLCQRLQKNKEYIDIVMFSVPVIDFDII